MGVVSYHVCVVGYLEPLGPLSSTLAALGTLTAQGPQVSSSSSSVSIVYCRTGNFRGREIFAVFVVSPIRENKTREI